ncbi:hypothetical protein SAMN02745751_03624 [Dethiosulfatibacter aminovorans DSM 17477]|uniref:Uncharacterized protein n=1 Tax=Dethiosulfatibacter aminovorans DSM 17477 TaxID=1121476 RepID=A0A1M6MXE9_9FIRM|nr:hypothetical protein [Dethiosulfatibacter aminovorans]SHJ88141.1 hypothetical protein SAMN02745751_03624 [Dethiosulfatibacter aminovorans DSM 17477]
MIVGAEKEKDNRDSAIRKNVMVMMFMLIISLLNFGINILTLIHVTLSSLVAIVYMFSWPKLNESRQNILVGIGYIINSISMFIIGFVFADVKNILLAGLLILFYVIEIIYNVLKSEKRMEESNRNQIRYTSAILIAASSFGLLFSRYMQRTFEYYINIKIAGLALIALAHIVA